MRDIEVWVVVDENGDYVVGPDQDSAVERFAEDVGGTLATRQVKVTIKVPLPKPIEVTAEIEEEDETVTVKTK